MRLPRHLAFEGDGDKAQVVPVVMPEVYAEPVELSHPAALAEALRVVVDLLDGPARGLPSRVAALKKLARGSSAGALRDLAKDTGCSPAAVHAALKLLDDKLKKRT
jgi:hypothetical protein